jgi:hypothetical protein
VFERLRRIRRVGSRKREQLMRLLPDLMGFVFFGPGLREQLAGLSLVRLRLLECLLYCGFMHPSLIGGDGRLHLVTCGHLSMVGRLAFVLRRQLGVLGRFVRPLGRVLLVPRGILAVLLGVAHCLRQLLGGCHRSTRGIAVWRHQLLSPLPATPIHPTGFLS